MKNTHYQIAAWSVLAAIVFVTVSPIQMRPGDLLSVDIDRAAAFGLLASVFMIAYPRHAMIVGLLVVASAGAMELLQLLSPTRHARLDDAVIKSGGALAGMAAALAYNRLRVARHAVRARRLVVTQWPAMDPAMAAVEAGMSTLPVSSGMIEAVYFSPADGRLRVRTRDGEERLFHGVSQEDANALVTAPSPDHHYVEQIRNKFSQLAA